ncbi:MAG TPA: hypothetical protein VI456_02825 [Polyangia bacterium]
MRSAGCGVLLACAMALAACGGGSGGTSSCAFGFTNLPGDQPFNTAAVCREWTGASDQVASRQEDCASLATTDGGITLQTMFSNGPCPRTDIVGGCRGTYYGVTSTDWYYPSQAATTTDVMNICALAGTTFVSHP